MSQMTELELAEHEHEMNLAHFPDMYHYSTDPDVEDQPEVLCQDLGRVTQAEMEMLHRAPVDAHAADLRTLLEIARIVERSRDAARAERRQLRLRLRCE